MFEVVLIPVLNFLKRNYIFSNKKFGMLRDVVWHVEDQDILLLHALLRPQLMATKSYIIAKTVIEIFRPRVPSINIGVVLLPRSIRQQKVQHSRLQQQKAQHVSNVGFLDIMPMNVGNKNRILVRSEPYQNLTNLTN
jgi:hypothetical protein